MFGSGGSHGADGEAEANLLLGLPDLDGLEVIRSLREWSHVPIVVLWARTEEGKKAAALDAGADDYVTRVYLARLRGKLGVDPTHPM
jgi:DNA-binding response OmpR family regulator